MRWGTERYYSAAAPSERWSNERGGLGDWIWSIVEGPLGELWVDRRPP